MTKIALILLLPITLLLADSFQTNIPRANDKPVLVLVEREGCPWCHRMKDETLQDPNIVQMLEGFHIVVMDQSRWNRLGFEQVQSVPTMFFLDEEKRVVNMVRGFWEPIDFRHDIRDTKALLEKN